MKKSDPILSKIGGKTFKNQPMEQLLGLWRIPFNDEIEPLKVETALRERIKELNCLYGIAHLVERHSDSIDDLLRDLVNFFTSFVAIS